MEKLYSSLKQEVIAKEEHTHALAAYNALGCKTFKNYHMAYLKRDVILLAYVFEKFRKACHECYGLDPANYSSAPGLAWDAMLLLTAIALELIDGLEYLIW